MDIENKIEENFIHYTDQHYIADIIMVVCSVYKVANYRSSDQNFSTDSKQSFNDFKAKFGPVLNLCE